FAGPGGVNDPSGCVASTYSGIDLRPFVTIWAEPATVFHKTTGSTTCVPSANAALRCTTLAWFDASTVIPGASVTIAYDCTGASNAENTLPSEAAIPISIAFRSADGKGRKKWVLIATCACCALR